MSNPSPTSPNIPPTSTRRGIRNDNSSENDLWKMCLDEVEEDDKRIAEAWKEDAEGILVFTGLFAATVGAFIIEFYKKLSPDSGNQTVALLGQLSQQLANFPSGNYSNAAIQPSHPSASMVWVIAMWMISLVLSLTSALIATLLQQWARRYVKTPKVPSEPNHCARVRWFLFEGTNVYQMRLLVEIAPTLLHLSVYLFFAGLAITFHTINKKVAIAVDVSVGLFGMAYIMLSILPCRDVRCPYRTPMSYILWYLYHIFLSFTALCLGWLLERLHGCIVEPSLGGNISSPRQRKLVEWLISCENTAKKHWQYVTDGFGKSVINGAINAQGDHKIITSLFSVLSLSDKSKLRKLAASIPRRRIDLIRAVESGKIVLRDSLLVLLRNCETGPRTSGPDEDARKRSLLVCLDAIRRISKTPDVPDSELNFVRANFASIGLMRTLWDDDDTAIRVTSRSICALIARRVGGRVQLEEDELRWLHDVTGETSHDIHNADVETRDRMNVKSFVNGVLSNQVGDLPTEDATSFRETLAILLDVSTDVDDFDTIFQGRLSAEVQRMREGGSAISDDVVYKLHSMFPYISLPAPPFPVAVIQSVLPPAPPPFPVAMIQSVPPLPLPTSTHAI